MKTKCEFFVYVIDAKHDSDNHITLELLRNKMFATNKQEAWKQFIKLTGKTRQHWNKLGFIARKVKITAKFTK